LSASRVESLLYEVEQTGACEKRDDELQGTVVSVQVNESQLSCRGEADGGITKCASRGRGGTRPGVKYFVPHAAAPLSRLRPSSPAGFPRATTAGQEKINPILGFGPEAQLRQQHLATRDRPQLYPSSARPASHTTAYASHLLLRRCAGNSVAGRRAQATEMKSGGGTACDAG
jgi:hypothetical protein